MYVKPEDLRFDILYQGDVLKSIPFFIFKEQMNILKNLEKANTYEIEAANEKSFENEDILSAVNTKSRTRTY